ncbi:peptidase S8/S53 domain-containing protein [Mycena vitilis]|nr:peptidase S8/S53 domain-containing protein [Mycena vitilis]
MFAPLLLRILVGLLASTSAHSRFAVKNALPTVPSGWAEVQNARLPPTHGLNMRFGLAPQGSHLLESSLRNTSDPLHPNYGDHLSKAQVHALSKPATDTIRMVEAWLEAHNANAMRWSSSRDSVSAVILVSFAERMLSTRFGVFQHIKSGKRVVRTLRYSLPETLLPHIAFVHPTTAFFDPMRQHGIGGFAPGVDGAPHSAVPHLKKRGLNQSDYISCVNVTDPPCVRQLYNLGDYKPDVTLNGSENHIGVAGYLNVWARADSLKLYLDDYIPESRGSNYTFDVVNITGPFIPASINAEGNLDTQLAIQVAYPIPMTYFPTNSIPPHIPDQNQDGIGSGGVNEPYLDFIDYVLGLDKPPTVITISYADDEQTVPQDYANAVCNGFAKLGARGISVLVSSGDSGLGVANLPETMERHSSPSSPRPALTLLQSEKLRDISLRFLFLNPGPDSPIISTGHDASVPAYLDGPANAHETALQSSMYNRQGRAYPDITCAGSGAFFNFFENEWDIGGGTSAAAPTAAGIVALLNDWRLRHGKPVMGFLNPFLYGAGVTGMVDIVEGLVSGCQQPGFNATRGWDPTSGLGFFDFGKLQSLVL